MNVFLFLTSPVFDKSDLLFYDKFICYNYLHETQKNQI